MTQHSCAECGSEFSNEQDLRQHRQDEHPRTSKAANRAKRVPGYECPLCDREFETDDLLRSHAVRAHQAPRGPPAMPDDPARPDKKGPPIVT
jgi:ribosomal protein L34E